MAKKDKKKDEEELDTQTSFADMNVEGLPWYDPHKKKGKQKVPVDREEYWKMVRAAFAAYLPLIGVIAGVGLLLFLIACLWMGT